MVQETILKHRTIAAALLLYAAAGASLAADYKIGFVNAERLWRDSAPLDKDGPTMGETERRNKERDLANQSRDLQRMERQFREDVNLRRAEELAAVQERANKILMQIAEAEKFDLILQEAVFASGKIDITEKVIKALADK